MDKMNKTPNKKQPYFSINVFNYYSHDYNYLPEGYDSYLKETIELFEKKGFLQHDVFIDVRSWSSPNRLLQEYSKWPTRKEPSVYKYKTTSAHARDCLL